jgi:hypothetical protein
MNLIFMTAVVAALMLGFLAGMLTFKRSLQWCRNCGGLTCPNCVQPRATQLTTQPRTRQPRNVRR